jgi:DNA-binding IclR family transcriptional regulator
MSAKLDRAFGLIEQLALHPEGRSLSSLSQSLDMPLSATHRLLTELCQCGYVRQAREQGDYILTIKIVSLGLNFLTNSGVVDVAQPLLDRLAAECRELVRLAVVDGDNLVFVAKAQGATRGLRYDPDMGLDVRLSCSSAGHALLSTLSDEEAMERVARQGFGSPEEYGPRAPTNMKALLTYVRAARKLGFSRIVEVFSPGMSAMAAPVGPTTGPAIGVVTIAGPSVRLTEARMMELGPLLIDTARDVYAASRASALFRARGG